MPKKRILWTTFVIALLCLTMLFTFLLKPQSNELNQLIEGTEYAMTQTSQAIEKTESTKIDTKKIEEKSERQDVMLESDEQLSELSTALRSIQAGQSSVINLVFSDLDLNQVIKELLELGEAKESWVNYALGQIVDTCGELHKRSEPELIEMFSSISNTNMPVQQQTTFNNLLPIVVDASKRCRSIDKDLMASLGGDARSWFRTGAEAGDANSFVNSGFTMLVDQLKNESEAYKNAADDERWKVGKDQFRATMLEKLKAGSLSPELMVNMSEHLNLFYEGNDKFKQKEAWVLLACEMGYENNCNSQSTAIKLMCMFGETCQAGSSFAEGVLWAQGQFKLDEYQNTANELRRVIENKEWEKLGF